MRRFEILRGGLKVGEGIVWSDGRIHDEYETGYSHLEGDERRDIDPVDFGTSETVGKLPSERFTELVKKIEDPKIAGALVEEIDKRLKSEGVENPTYGQILAAFHLNLVFTILDERLGRAPGKAVP